MREKTEQLTRARVAASRSATVFVFSMRTVRICELCLIRKVT